MMTLRLSAPLATLLFAACASEQPAEPVTEAEAAVTSQAVEDTIVTVSAMNTTDLRLVAAGYRSDCAVVETDDLTFVMVTYTCTGPLATHGTIRLELTAPQTVVSTGELAIGGVAIDGSATLTIPADPTKPRTFDGQLTVTGPRRELDAEAHATWIPSGNSCVTINGQGATSVGAASRTWVITNATACRR
jgi:hypothetical protein